MNNELMTIDSNDLANVTGGYKVWSILGEAALGAVQGAIGGVGGGWAGIARGAALGGASAGVTEYEREVAAHRAATGK